MENFIKLITALVPVIQSFLWVSLSIILIWLFYKQTRKLLETMGSRIEKGSSFKAGPVELGADLQNLNEVTPVSSDGQNQMAEDSPSAELCIPEKDSNTWATERTKIYQENQGVFLTHVISPCSDQKKNLRHEHKYYDVFVYPIRHKTTDFCDIEKAQFFFGHMWKNEVFEEKERNGMIGVQSSAYGPFLCTCRVFFKDGKTAFIHRYIDFEMARAFR